MAGNPRRPHRLFCRRKRRFRGAAGSGRERGNQRQRHLGRKLRGVRLERDDFVMFDRTDALNTRIQTDNVRVPQASTFMYDTTEKGYGVDQLLTRKPDGTLVNDLRWFLEIDGAMTVTSLVEYIGGLEI